MVRREPSPYCQCADELEATISLLTKSHFVLIRSGCMFARAFCQREHLGKPQNTCWACWFSLVGHQLNATSDLGSPLPPTPDTCSFLFGSLENHLTSRTRHHVALTLCVPPRNSCFDESQLNQRLCVAGSAASDLAFTCNRRTWQN